MPYGFDRVADHFHIVRTVEAMLLCRCNRFASLCAFLMLQTVSIVRSLRDNLPGNYKRMPNIDEPWPIENLMEAEKLGIFIPSDPYLRTMMTPRYLVQRKYKTRPPSSDTTTFSPKITVNASTVITMGQQRKLLNDGVSFPGRTDTGIQVKTEQDKPRTEQVKPRTNNEATTEKSNPDTSDIDACGKISNNICEDIPSYPKELIRRLLQQKKVSKDAFGNDTLDDVSVRFGEPHYENPCRTQEKRIFPKAAMTEASEWKYIVQGNEIGQYDFTQGIRIEICEQKGKPTNLPGRLSFPESNNGEEFECVQRYIYRKLPTILNATEIYYETFKIPSCCAVMIRKF